MKLLRGMIAVLMATLFVFSAANAVFALSTSDAKEKIDTGRSCSLTLTYAVDKQPCPGLEIEAYQAATVTADFQYSMTGAFSDYAVELNGIKSQSEWNEVRDTVGAYVIADKIAPTSVGTTDEKGVVKFEDLPVGIYYIRWTGNETDYGVTGFAPFVIAVPGLGEDGLWIYDVDALPKPGELPTPQTKELTVVKMWRDNSDYSKRPQAISIEIYKNGQLFEGVRLTEEGNWTYTWETDEDAVWTAVERDVPEGYTVTVQSGENVICITNTSTEEPPIDPPQTGESTGIYLWVLLMALSGAVLLLLGVLRKRRFED